MDFIFLAAGAGALYGLQSSLLAKYSRSHGGLTAATVRNLSFIITMAPVLYFVPSDAWSALSIAWPWLLATCLCGALALSTMMTSVQHLPIGFSSAFFQLTPLLMLLWGFLIFDEILNLKQLLAMLVLLFGVYLLASKRPQHGVQFNIKRGLPLVLTSVFFGSLGFFALSQATAIAHPLLVGYFWEIGIGIILAIFILFRYLFLPKHKSPKTLTLQQIGKIALCASPTVVASSLLPMALKLGSAGVAMAINGALGIIVTVFLGLILYREHLHLKQIFYIIIIIIGMIGIRIF